MAEVTVAFFVLLLAVLAIIGIMTRMSVAQGVSSHQAVAYVVADKVLKDAISAGPPEWGVEPDKEKSLGMVVGQMGALEKFYYDVAAVPVPEPTGDEAVYESGLDMGDLYLVEVTVWWGGDENGPSAAVERGERRIRLGKMIYAQS
ncbi:MAG: hypothetical protein KC800_11435 [Candidatus Eremiobacteraeota bacterium]|nr:hypothetical protein [Candidatus Eremiobacteraeota bacterium]